MTDTTTPADEREAFEAWAGPEGYKLRIDAEDAEYYDEARTQHAWAAWQARSASQPAQLRIIELTERVRELESLHYGPAVDSQPAQEPLKSAVYKIAAKLAMGEPMRPLNAVLDTGKSPYQRTCNAAEECADRLRVVAMHLRNAVDAAPPADTARQDRIERILENLRSVLCDPEGKCCITGSEGDRRWIDAQLAALEREVRKPT